MKSRKLLENAEDHQKMDYKQIVWLSSYPKSGNTWVRCFLDAYLTGEVDINKLVASVSDDSAARALPGDGSDPSLFPIDVQMLCRPMGLLRLVRAFEANREETGSKVPLFVKTHNAHMIPNGIELLPHCLTKSVIYIVRDPRDVIISFAKHMGLEIDEAIDVFLQKYRVLADERISKMSDFISSWPLAVASYANSDSHNVKIFRYEDIKADPVQMFSKILIHAGIEPDINRVKQAVETVELDKLRKQQEKDGFREASPHNKEFFGQGKTGGWKDILTPAQVLRIEKNCRTMMKRFNYKFSMKAVA